MLQKNFQVRLGSILTLSLIFALVGGCGDYENNVYQGNRDGVLHVGNGTEPQSLDPHIATGVPEHHIISAVMEGLVAKDRKTLMPKPGVAESWTISDDLTVYTFKLRRNARWSNGDAHTAHDYAWSWWRALQPALGNQYAYMLFPIDNAQQYYEGDISDFDQVGVKALDDYTLQVTLGNPTPYFLQLLDHYSLYPVHQATILKFGDADERGTRWTYEDNLVGNGPFQLSEWKINRRIEVQKNGYYWDVDNVRLNNIIFYPTDNVTTEERMFRAGQLHITSSIPADKIQTYKDANDLSLRIAPYLGTYFFRININTPHLSDKRVRRALGMAIDREKLTKNILKGGQIPAYAITPPGTVGYYADTDLTFDPSAARTLLAEAGYPDGANFPVTEILYNTNEAHRKVAVAIQQMWRENLNLDLELLNQEWKVYLQTESSGNYQISRAGWIGDYVDPNNFLDMFLCDGGNNRTGWCNPEYDNLILEVAPTMTSHEERLAIFAKAEKMLLDDMPILPIYTYTSNYLINSAVKNYDSNLMNHSVYKDIFLDPALPQAARGME
ncbi:MAG: oligopeptide transport system substrate-binding protein [Porticoccaceae bacterium]|jgi:oligopeptide transport system substrate-binding protein|tara:strand:- start:2464 stop:4128 length:1665 start_codon:yes stop_codon:yes gene_type:complete